MSSVADVAKEIFENENVVPANTDKGAAAILAKAPEGFTPSFGKQENATASETATATILEEENVVISQDPLNNIEEVD